jgi:hypothetical protein
MWKLFLRSDIPQPAELLSLSVGRVDESDASAVQASR